MEKALETIKEHMNDLERMVDVFSFYGCFNSAAECKKANKELNEAISELEEAMKPKTCEGCRYGAFGVNGLGFEVECRIGYNCSRGREDRYEPKDNA